MDQPEAENDQCQMEEVKDGSAAGEMSTCRSEEAVIRAKKEAQKEKLLRKGRLFDIRWKNFLPSTVTPIEVNGQGDGTTQRFYPAAWLLGENTVLPATKNFVMTKSFEKEFCVYCWGENRKFACPNASDHISTPHCMISHKDNSYCIKDLESEKGTFVNGVKLEPLSPQELVHGDIISLGISHEDPLLKKKNAPNVVFYYEGPLKTVLAQEAEVQKTEEMPLAVVEVLGNEYLLSKILSSLPLCDLKNVRLVNKMWNKESSKWFYAKSLQVLPDLDCTRWRILVEPYWPYHKNANIHAAFKELKHAYPINKKTPEFHRRDPKSPQCGQGVLNLKSYFQNNGKNIGTLDLEMHAKNLHVLTSELRSFRNLRELNLIVDLRGFSEEEVMKFETDSVGGLPSVQKLTFEFLDAGFFNILRAETAIRYEEFFKCVLKMVPSLSMLCLGTYAAGGQDITELLNILERNPELIEKLTGFSIMNYNDDSPVFMQFRALLNLPFKKPLKNLVLGQLHCVTFPPLTDPGVVTGLIDKFSDSLKHLSLGIGYDYSTREIPNLLTYTIPPLPKLKSFELTVWNEALRLEETPADHCWLNFPNPDGLGGVTSTVDYGVIFPQLKTLVFKYLYEEKNKPKKLSGSKTMSPFIPRVGDVKCPSLTKLVLPRMWRKLSDPEYRLWLIRLTEIFPNVHSPLFSNVRAGKWDELDVKEKEEADSDADVSTYDEDD